MRRARLKSVLLELMCESSKMTGRKTRMRRSCADMQSSVRRAMVDASSLSTGLGEKRWQVVLTQMSSVFGTVKAE